MAEFVKESAEALVGKEYFDTLFKSYGMVAWAQEKDGVWEILFQTPQEGFILRDDNHVKYWIPWEKWKAAVAYWMEVDAIMKARDNA